MTLKIMEPQTPEMIAATQEKKILQMCEDFFKNLKPEETVKLFENIKGLNKDTAQRLIIEKGDELQTKLFWATRDILGRMATYKTPQEIFEGYFILRPDSPKGFLVYDLNDPEGRGNYISYLKMYLEVAKCKCFFPDTFHFNGNRWQVHFREYAIELPEWKWLAEEVLEKGTAFHIPYDGFVYDDKDPDAKFRNILTSGTYKLDKKKESEEPVDLVGFDYTHHIAKFNFTGQNKMSNAFIFPESENSITELRSKVEAHFSERKAN